MKEESLSILRSLNAKFPHLVRFYNKAELQMIDRVDTWLLGKLDETLKDIYKISDGLSILDYCILGCGNKKILNIIDHNKLIWNLIPELENKFVVFASTSTGDNFGYFTNGTNPVGYFNTSSSNNNVLVIASSVGKFFEIFVDEINNTILASTTKSDLFSIELNDWPRDMNYWFTKDIDLKRLYS